MFTKKLQFRQLIKCDKTLKKNAIVILYRKRIITVIIPLPTVNVTLDLISLLNLTGRPF